MSPTDGQARRTVAGRYVLRGLLGKGGMADVELAYDEVLDRQVAIKMLHDQFIRDDNFVDRFRREAQSAAALNHPNVVAVYDTGSDGGRPYIVMEYVAGRTLREILKTDAITPARAAEIAAEAAEALSFAHERGIVHRDIKPGNIMIADDGRIKVCDFGIARAANAENVTQTAAVFGTAAYVAPEQAQGQKVDGRTDLYALGCVLFEMLTGRQPYIGDSPVALAYKHVSETPPDPRQLNPEVPPALERVVMRAMAKDPDARYASGKDFARDLRLAASGQPISPDPGVSTSAYETTRLGGPQSHPQTYEEEDYDDGYDDEGYAPLRSRTWLNVLGIVLVLALIGGGGVLAFRYFNATKMVTVPDIVGKSFQDAQTALLADQLQPALGESKPSDTVEANHVISTDPLGGAQVERGSRVTMILSSGPDTVPIPALSRMSRSQAEEILRQLDLKVGNVTREPDPDIARGLVIGSQPAAGTSVTRGTSINLVISSGGESFKMPNLTDLTEKAARDALAKVCGSPTCVVVKVETDEKKVGDGRVLRTKPEAGEEFREGETIILTVSRLRADADSVVIPGPSSGATSPGTSSTKPSPSTKPSSQPNPTTKPNPTSPASPQPLPTAKPPAKPTSKPTSGTGGSGGDIDVAPPTPAPGN